jgi:putative membrane protein
MTAPAPGDPRVLFAAERTLLAWQRSSVALMGFGFVIERFSLFLSVLRRESERPGQHLISLLVGVLLILLGAGVSLVTGLAYRRFVRGLSPDSVPQGYWLGFGFVINLVVAALGVFLAAYLLIDTLLVAAPGAGTSP